MGSLSPSVLVLNNGRYFQQFHKHLCDTLSCLACDLVVTTKWSEALDALDAPSLPYDLIVLDPTVRGFDASVAASALSGHAEGVPRALVRMEPRDEFEALSASLRVSANLYRYFTPPQISFVANRLMFPAEADRRRHLRVLASVTTDCVLEQTGDSFREETFTLSLGGAFLRSYCPEPAGGRLLLKMHIPFGKPPIRVYGRIAYRNLFAEEPCLLPPGMGVEFEELDEAGARRIGALIRDQALPVDRKLL